MKTKNGDEQIVLRINPGLLSCLGSAWNFAGAESRNDLICQILEAWWINHGDAIVKRALKKQRRKRG